MTFGGQLDFGLVRTFLNKCNDVDFMATAIFDVPIVSRSNPNMGWKVTFADLRRSNR